MVSIETNPQDKQDMEGDGSMLRQNAVFLEGVALQISHLERDLEQ